VSKIEMKEVPEYLLKMLELEKNGPCREVKYCKCEVIDSLCFDSRTCSPSGEAGKVAE
jgi:hypothetical protein